MNKILSFAFIGASFSFGQPVYAQTACAPEFVDSSVSVVVPNIEVDAGGSSSEPIRIRVRNAGETAVGCAATLRIAYLSTSPSSNPISYSIDQGGRSIDILPNETTPGTSASEVPVPQVPKGPNGRNVPFQLTVPSGWGLASGSQVNDLVVLLVNSEGLVVDTLPLTIALTVPPAVEVRFVGVTGQSEIANINLGILDPLATNVSDPFGVRIWSTSPYSVSFQSLNEGVLMHSERGSTIQYKLFMNGQQVNVRGAQAANIPQHTGPLGDIFPTGITVDPFSARAGDYSDRIEVTVTAN